MAIGFFRVTVHSRLRGQSAAAFLAYRAGIALDNARTGSRHDYRRRASREEIAATGITGEGGPSVEATRARLQHFADAAEAGEKRRDACILRDFQISLPHELDDVQRRVLADRFARHLSAKFRTYCAWAVHRPDRQGDVRNHHAHVCMLVRNVDGKKLRSLDDRTTGAREIRALREQWQDMANAALVEVGFEPGVNTGKAGADETAPTLGPVAVAIERRRRAAIDGAEPEGQSVERLLGDGRAFTKRGRALQKQSLDRAFAEIGRSMDDPPQAKPPAPGGRAASRGREDRDGAPPPAP